MCEEKPLAAKVGFENETRCWIVGSEIAVDTLATAPEVPALDCVQQCMGQ